MSQERSIEALFDAVDSGDLEKTRELLSSFGSLDLSTWPRSYALLLKAVRNEHTEIAELLLKNNCKINSKDFQQNSTTPLHVAVSTGDLKIVQMLIERQSKIDALDEKLETPLMKAIEICLNESNESTHKTTCKIIELLVKNGADFHTSKTGRTPFQKVIDNRKIELLKLLLESSNDPNAGNKLKPFIGALARNYRDSTSEDRIAIAELLLRHGALSQTREEDRVRMLHKALEKRDLEFAKLLVKYNVDINARDEDGVTLLHIAVNVMTVSSEREEPTAMVNLLLEMGADPNLYNPFGFTALQKCMSYDSSCEIKCEERIAIVENLLSHGADFNASSIVDGARGYELLFLATSSYAGTDFLEYLLSKGADINGGRDYTSTALYVAAEIGAEEYVRFLLDHGAKSDPEGPNGESILEIAVRSRCLEVVKLILNSCYPNSESLNYKVSVDLWSSGAKRFFEKLGKWLKSRAGNNDGITENQCRTVLNNFLEDAYNQDVTLNPAEERDGVNPLRWDRWAWQRHPNCSFEMRGDAPYFRPPGKLYRDEAEIVKLLLSRRINIDFKDYDERTLLSYAIKYNDIEITKLCLTTQTKVAIDDFKVAIAMGRRDVVDMLLAHDPSIYSNDAYGHILSHSVIKKKDFPFINEPDLIVDDDAKDDIAILLISKGSNKTRSDLSLEVLLAPLAAEYNRLKILEFLVKGNPSLIDECSRNGEGLLSAAARNNHLDVVKFLLKIGADVDQIDSYNYSAFYLACRNGHAELAEFLLKSGACMRDIVDTHFFGFSECPEIREVIKRHIVRTICSGELSSGAVLRQYKEITSNQALNEFLGKCKEEASRMRNEMIGDSNVCFYDIIEKRRDRLTMFAKNESICEAMKSEDLILKFPLHHDLMKDNFLKGQKRAPLIDSARKAIHSVGRWETMPELTIDRLFSYLDDEDLKNLIEAGPRCDS